MSAPWCVGGECPPEIFKQCRARHRCLQVWADIVENQMALSVWENLSKAPKTEELVFADRMAAYVWTCRVNGRREKASI